MMTLARGARALIVGLAAASVAIGVGGCTTYATPDGHTLWSANGPNDVERVLGEAILFSRLSITTGEALGSARA